MRETFVQEALEQVCVSSLGATLSIILIILSKRILRLVVTAAVHFVKLLEFTMRQAILRWQKQKVLILVAAWAAQGLRIDISICLHSRLADDQIMLTFLANNCIAGDALLQLQWYAFANYALDQTVERLDLLF